MQISKTEKKVAKNKRRNDDCEIAHIKSTDTEVQESGVDLFLL